MKKGGAVTAAGFCQVPRRQACIRDSEKGRRERGEGPCGAIGESLSPLPSPQRSEVLQPGEGLLARPRLYEGRPDRVLPRRLSLAASVLERPTGCAHAISGRHRRRG